MTHKVSVVVLQLWWRTENGTGGVVTDEVLGCGDAHDGLVVSGGHCGFLHRPVLVPGWGFWHGRPRSLLEIV